MEAIKNDENFKILCEALLEVETFEECQKFLTDICTIPELKAISQRLVVAKMLDDKCNYQDIVDKTGASTATISRVNRSLLYGEGGYETIFTKLNSKEEKD